MQRNHLLKKRNFTCWGRKLTWTSYLKSSRFNRWESWSQNYTYLFKLLNKKVPTSYEREPFQKLPMHWHAGDGHCPLDNNVCFCLICWSKYSEDGNHKMPSQPFSLPQKRERDHCGQRAAPQSGRGLFQSLLPIWRKCKNVLRCKTCFFTKCTAQLPFTVRASLKEDIASKKLSSLGHFPTSVRLHCNLANFMIREFL